MTIGMAQKYANNNHKLKLNSTHKTNRKWFICHPIRSGMNMVCTLCACDSFLDIYLLNGLAIRGTKSIENRLVLHMKSASSFHAYVFYAKHWTSPLNKKKKIKRKCSFECETDVGSGSLCSRPEFSNSISAEALGYFILFFFILFRRRRRRQQPDDIWAEMKWKIPTPRRMEAESKWNLKLELNWMRIGSDRIGESMKIC